MSALPDQLDFASVGSVLDRSEALIATGTLDLSPVQSVDSAGVALLLELTRRAKRNGKTLTLTGAAVPVRELSAFFGVDSLLSFQ